MGSSSSSHVVANVPESEEVDKPESALSVTPVSTTEKTQPPNGRLDAVDVSDLCDRCGETEAIYYKREDRQLVCGACYGELSLRETRDHVRSLQFKQCEIKTRSDLEQRRVYLEGQIRRHDRYDERIRSKKGDLTAKIGVFERDVHALVKHLADDMRQKTASTLESKLRLKNQYIDRLKEHLESINDVAKMHAQDDSDSGSASKRVKMIRACEDVLEKTAPVNEDTVEPEDLELKFDLDLKMKDIFGNDQATKKVELGGFRIVEAHKEHSTLTKTLASESFIEKDVVYTHDVNKGLVKELEKTEDMSTMYDSESRFGDQESGGDDDEARNRRRFDGLPSNRKRGNRNNFYFFDPRDLRDANMPYVGGVTLDQPAHGAQSDLRATMSTDMSKTLSYI